MPGVRLKERDCLKPSALVHRRHSAKVSSSDFVLFFSDHFRFEINSITWGRTAADRAEDVSVIDGQQVNMSFAWMSVIQRKS